MHFQINLVMLWENLFLHPLSSHLSGLCLFKWMPKVSRNVNAIKLGEHTRTQICTSSSKENGNCYWNTTCFMAVLPSWLQSLPSAVKSVCLPPLSWSLSLKNSWMPAAKSPIKGSSFLAAKVATSRCVNSYISFQQPSFSVSARQTSPSLLLASVCRNYDNIWPDVRWAKSQGNALDLAVHVLTKGMAKSFGEWPKWQGRKHKQPHKQPKYGWLGWALEMEAKGLRYPRVVRSSASAPWHRKEPIEVVWRLIRMLLGCCPLEVFQAHPNWTRATEWSEDSLEGLHIVSGLGVPTGGLECSS